MNNAAQICHKTDVVIIGGGFTGLAAAYELVKKGVAVTVLEAEAEIAGLAAAFNVGGEKLDRFYHHWFTNDMEVMQLIDELGLNDRVDQPDQHRRLLCKRLLQTVDTMESTELHTIVFFVDRIRLGLLALRARRVKDWMALEGKTAHEWLKELGGENVYRIVWQPLLKGKFGPYAEEVCGVVLRVPSFNGGLLVAWNYYERQGKREWWSVHVEAWQRSCLTQIKYCNIHGLERGTFSRWLNALTDAKMAKLRVERVAAERNQSRKNKPLKLSLDKRNQAVQAYWAMHVEALNWSGLTIREYAKALRLSPWSREDGAI